MTQPSGKQDRAGRNLIYSAGVFFVGTALFVMLAVTVDVFLGLGIWILAISVSAYYLRQTSSLLEEDNKLARGDQSSVD